MIKYQDKLRQQCRIVKALYKISYIDIANALKMPHNSFYNWLNGYYNFNYKHSKELEKYLFYISKK